MESGENPEQSRCGNRSPLPTTNRQSSRKGLAVKAGEAMTGSPNTCAILVRRPPSGTPEGEAAVALREKGPDDGGLLDPVAFCS